MNLFHPPLPHIPAARFSAKMRQVRAQPPVEILLCRGEILQNARAPRTQPLKVSWQRHISESLGRAPRNPARVPVGCRRGSRRLARPRRPRNGAGAAAPRPCGSLAPIRGVRLWRPGGLGPSELPPSRGGARTRAESHRADWPRTLGPAGPAGRQPGGSDPRRDTSKGNSGGRKEGGLNIGQHEGLKMSRI